MRGRRRVRGGGGGHVSGRGSVLKLGEGSITLEGSAPWEEKGSGEGKGSKIVEGPDEGEGSATDGSAITEGSRQRECLAAVDMKRSRKGVAQKEVMLAQEVVLSSELGDRGKVESWSLCLSATLLRGHW